MTISSARIAVTQNNTNRQDTHAAEGGKSWGYLRDVQHMGVIQVLQEAAKFGFQPGNPDWINLGRGEPEIGQLQGGPARIDHIDLCYRDHAYGPIGGINELRSMVASYYNETFRQGMSSLYSPENVAIVQGGRLALSRVFTALGEVNVGYMVPDYSSYEDMLGMHLSRITPIPVRTSPEEGFHLNPGYLSSLVSCAGIGAFLMSNPCNPTGALLGTDELAVLLEHARNGHCALLVDEFYSHYHYDQLLNGTWIAAQGPVSIAAVVGNVNTDQVLLIDGLTKNFRYPGWRLAWIVGPADAIETINRVGSALDGGPSQIVQRAAMIALDPEYVMKETNALRTKFTRKRNLTISNLREIGFQIIHEPQGTFYVWASLANLPPPFDDADFFFQRALRHSVITVPGRLFDVNPGRRRRNSLAYRQWMRFSFGPSYEEVAVGLARLSAMIAT